MKRDFLALTLLALLASCHSTHNAQPKEAQAVAVAPAAIPNDTTPKVLGIGGIFFYTDDPKATRAWYSQHLGLEINDWGSASFESRDLQKPDQINSLQWNPFKTGNSYFAPSKKDFMINYRVQNIEGLVRNLQASGVTIVDTLATYDYGKFIHIMDAEGNKIELWEPGEE